MGPNKTLDLCTGKETTDPMKRQPIEQQKYLSNGMICKWLISQIYIQFIQLIQLSINK